MNFIALQFYAKTGKCKFGANCKFHHPKDIQIPLSGEDAGATVKAEAAEIDGLAGGDSMLTMTHVTITPALFHNSKGLPIRPVNAILEYLFFLKLVILGRDHLIK